MENKAFSIDFRATVDLAGSLHIEAETQEEAQLIAKRLIKQCLEKEYCDIELLINDDEEDGNFLTVKEMGYSRGLNITNSMALN